MLRNRGLYLAALILWSGQTAPEKLRFSQKSTSSGPSPSSTAPRSTSLGSAVTSSPTPSDPASSTETAAASSRSSATPTTSPPGGTDGLIGTSFNPAAPSTAGIPSVSTSTGTNLTPSSFTPSISAVTSLALPAPSVVHGGVTSLDGNFSSAVESTRTIGSAVLQSAGTSTNIDHGADSESGAETKNVPEVDGNGSTSTGMGASPSANSINDLGGHCSCGNTPRKTATIITATTITTTVVVAAASFAITVVLRRRRRQRRRAKITARRGSLGHRVEPTAGRGRALVLYTPVQTHEQEGETESRSVEGPSVPLLGV